MRLSAFLIFLAPVLYSAQFRIDGNLHYDVYSDTVLDVLQPATPALANRPAVVLIHGGGWVGGSKADMLPVAQTFVSRGLVAVNVEYRLADAAPAPAAAEDIARALKWVRDHAADYKIDTAKITLVGLSAGGHLALLTGFTNKVAAIVDFYGIADVADQLEGPNQRDYAAQWLPAQSGRLELARRLSPMSYIRKDNPPVLAIHGDADDTVPYNQSVELVKALKAAGAKAELITLPHGGHGLSDAQLATLWPQIFKWLQRVKAL